MRTLDKFRGCLVGGAVGDALGYSVEFMQANSIFSKYGPKGIIEYDLHNGTAQISDDTQMTLFTATGLLFGTTRGKLRGIMGSYVDYIRLSYKDWYRTQTESFPLPKEFHYSWLVNIPELFSRRAPGNTCMSALGSEIEGSIEHPINHSKGCGGVMRVAPIGLYFADRRIPIEKSDKIGAEAAAITHGHELGWLPAAALVHIIRHLVEHEGSSILTAVQDARGALQKTFPTASKMEDFQALLQKAIDLSSSELCDLDAIGQLGQGWVGDEALAIAVFCALRHSDNFKDAIVAAVNHSGDSDSTGAITGNIMGAALGVRAIPQKYLDTLELKDVILELADDLYNDCQMEEYGDYEDPIWLSKYVRMDYIPKKQANTFTARRNPMITIQKASITELTTDAIVNAANTHLKAGSGVCGAIFSAAGKTQLQAACDAIGYCPVGSAVITPGFNTHSKYIIHAVGPKWNGGDPNSALYCAYKSALKLATEYGCTSIGFPLISAGVYGYPVDKAWQEAVRACREFPDLQIVFAIRDDQIIAEGKSALVHYKSTQQKKPSTPTESLTISGKTVDAIFFHKTTEPNGFLCNWYPSPFTMDGITFNCMEQYMMYQKAVIFGDGTTASAILAASDPSTQKQLGRSVSGYDHNVWAGMRQMVVLRGLMVKFGQNEKLRDQLLATGDAYLVEASKHDRNWGIGVDLKDDARKDASNWQGSNLLGFALMEVRRML